MPKRKRTKKSRKGRSRKHVNITKKNICEESSMDEVMRTCFDDDSLNRSKAVSPLQLVTPLRNSLVNNTEPFVDVLSPIRTTPVNRQRSVARSDRMKYSSMNVTNLNFLFESNFLQDSAESRSGLCLDELNGSCQQRSNSSIAKFHSPIVEKPTNVSHDSEIGDVEGIENKKCNEILDTPRVSRLLLVDKTKSEEICEMPSKSNRGLLDDNPSNGDKNAKFYNGFVNVNPYLNNKEISVIHRDGSFGEISFFSSNLFQHKSSSTPIEKLNQANDVEDILRGSSRKEIEDECLDLPDDADIPTPPKLSSNLDLNGRHVSEEVINNENSPKIPKTYTLSPSRRKSYKSSPKSYKILSQSKLFNKKQTWTYSRLNISRRSSIDSVESVSRLNRSGIGERLLSRLRKYTRVSHRWSVKVMELCSQLGVHLKNSLTSMCNLYNDRSMLESPEKKICRCEEYRRDISTLNLKIEELSEEVKMVKSKIHEDRSNKEVIEFLKQELHKVREELAQFKELRSELDSVKEQFNCLKTKSDQGAPCVPPPPPCKPPPPPPPPPLPLLTTPSRNSLKISKKTSTKQVHNDDSRPVISLDDILKVKLKKATDRSSCVTPTASRLSQPVVSMDMLRQVKLKPASRTSFRPDTPDTGASVLSTSPHSSLCRLLINDGSMFRLKRLRKVGGYSFDSVYRKSAMSTKRERDGS